MNIVFMILSAIVNISISSLMLYYLHQLRNNKECNDYDYSKDWRHNALYVLAIYNIIVVLILLLLSIPALQTYKRMLPLSVRYLLVLMHGFVGIIYVYSFFSYVGMHNKNKLGCLTSESPLNTVHKFLNIWRYVLLFVFILSLLLPLIFTFYTLLRIDLSRNNNHDNNINNKKK